MINRSVIQIFYSDEDEGFIAVVPELPGCSAFGATEEDALVEVKAAMALWLETARAEGCPILEPAGWHRSPKFPPLRRNRLHIAVCHGSRRDMFNNEASHR